METKIGDPPPAFFSPLESTSLGVSLPGAIMDIQILWYRTYVSSSRCRL